MPLIILTFSVERVKDVSLCVGGGIVLYFMILDLWEKGKNRFLLDSNRMDCWEINCNHGRLGAGHFSQKFN